MGIEKTCDAFSKGDAQLDNDDLKMAGERTPKKYEFLC